jgi:hypothetical protein
MMQRLAPRASAEQRTREHAACEAQARAGDRSLAHTDTGEVADERQREGTHPREEPGTDRRFEGSAAPREPDDGRDQQ